MPEAMDERDLERTLSEIGRRIVPSSRDLWPAVRARIAERRAAPWWTRLGWEPRALAPIGATLVVILAAAFLLTPELAARAAQVLGIPGVQIYRVGETPTVQPTAPAVSFPGQRVATLAEASRVAAFTVRAPTALGEPSAIYVETSPVRVTIVYTSVPGIAQSAQANVSAIVVEFRGAIDTQLMAKVIGPNTTLDAVPFGSSVGYWLAGQPHQFFFRDPAGNVMPETLRLAGNTLLWEEGGVTYRLEAEVGRDEALRIASSMR